MSEERYVKQIVSDVMEMAAKIKFLEAKVAASESWNAECVADHDAALRRAKAEVLQEVMELCLRDPLFKQFVEKGFWGAHHVDIVWRHNGQDKQHEADWLKSLWYLLRKLDARAAQIEEGG